MPVVLKDVGIEREPELFFVFGETELGKYIGVAVFDADILKNINKS